MTPSQPCPGPTPTQPMRILVADRNRMGSQLLSESLSHDPRFETVVAASAADLLPIVAARHPHVAVISADLDSGTRKGLQLARNLMILALRPLLPRAQRICCLSSRPGTPMWLLSARTLILVQERGSNSRGTS